MTDPMLSRLQRDMQEFRDAWRTFILTFAESLHLDKAVDWLIGKLTKERA